MRRLRFRSCQGQSYLNTALRGIDLDKHGELTSTIRRRRVERLEYSPRLEESGNRCEEMEYSRGGVKLSLAACCHGYRAAASTAQVASTTRLCQNGVDIDPI